MSNNSTMTCRVRGFSPRNNSYDYPRRFNNGGVVYTLRPPEARKMAMRLAHRASIQAYNAVFIVETLSDTQQWVNKDIWHRGIQYEIVGDKIPGFPFPHLTDTLLEI